MQIEIIGVDWDGCILEADDHLDCFALGPRRKIEQRMLIQAQLGHNPFEASILRHATILAEATAGRTRGQSLFLSSGTTLSSRFSVPRRITTWLLTPTLAS